MAQKTAANAAVGMENREASRLLRFDLLPSECHAQPFHGSLSPGCGFGGRMRFRPITAGRLVPCSEQLRAGSHLVETTINKRWPAPPGRVPAPLEAPYRAPGVAAYVRRADHSFPGRHPLVVLRPSVSTGLVRCRDATKEGNRKPSARYH